MVRDILEAIMKRRFMFAAAIVLVLCATAYRAKGAAPAPTMTNVSYGKHERNKLDFWKAKSSKPTPLVVFFHGGGFKFGDKADIHRTIAVSEYLAKGVSCISVNYPFLQHKGNDYSAILKDCKKATDFIVRNARALNIDKKRIGVSGVSAGALISEWLGCTTRYIRVMGVYMQPMGTREMILRRLNRRCPPIFIYQPSPPSDSVHHPKYAQMLEAACKKKRVKCVLWGTGTNGITKLPDGKDAKTAMMEFFFKAWGMKPLG
jgi:predicted esterase